MNKEETEKIQEEEDKIEEEEEEEVEENKKEEKKISFKKREDYSYKLEYPQSEIDICVKILKDLYWKRDLLKKKELEEVLEYGKKLFSPKELKIII
jgi:hypothetical protein